LDFDSPIKACSRIVSNFCDKFKISWQNANVLHSNYLSEALGIGRAQSVAVGLLAIQIAGNPTAMSG
jgi:hypothetical protein